MAMTDEEAKAVLDRGRQILELLAAARIPVSGITFLGLTYAMQMMENLLVAQQEKTTTPLYVAGNMDEARHGGVRITIPNGGTSAETDSGDAAGIAASVGER